MSIPYVDIHTHRASTSDISIRSFRPCEIASGVYSVGVHPYFLDDEGFDAGAVAVGEIGLDYSLPQLDKEKQLSVFKAQLSLAQKHDLPVVIHCVKALNDVMVVLKDYNLRAVIFHGFIGSEPMVKTLVSRGYFISLGAVSLSSPRTIMAAKTCPLTQFFLETDDTDFTISEIYKMASFALGVSIKELKENIYSNYKRIF